ncbi:MAG TPA: HEAT repeat domain-containing protein [Terriglobales bacterium]|nr:HEAT repeat domain-containing protein [Terriglobales bacterium]
METMKCDWVKANLLLYIYDELLDDARYELEQHVARCSECAAELAGLRQFKTSMSVVPVQDPTPNLLTASRMRLQEALESAEQPRFWQRWTFDLAAVFSRSRFSPALASIIFIVGFAAGIGSTYKIVSGNSPQVATVSAPAAPAEASVSGIRTINQIPGSNKVEIKYDTVTTQSAEGSLNDARIQQLLLFAARNNYNSGVRLDSVDLLSQQPQDQRIREALIYALRYDSNPGVRLKALNSLGAYVRQDVRVRDAVLEALMNDANPGVRTEAIHLLEPVRADSSVREVLQHLARQDKNAYIRTESRAVLAEMPEID